MLLARRPSRFFARAASGRRASGRRAEELRKLRAGGRAGTPGEDGEPHPLGKENERRVLGSEWNSEDRVLERLLDSSFIVILLSLASQLIFERLLKML